MLALRLRIFAALATPVALGACGARTSTPTGNAVDASVPLDTGVADVKADVPNTCPSPSSAKEQCFTKSELESIWYNPPVGGDQSDANPGPPPFDPNGCLPAHTVMNGCCNVAINGPRYQNGTCCYTFCEGGCCGRPWLVDGTARVAPVVERADWGSHGSRAELSADERALLAELWLADARMEHASIASFARFALELLAVGAPPELLEASHRAALDEIEHAKLCFALAARFTGAEAGPGALDVAGCDPSTELATIVERAVVEGCVGETVAAGVATERLAGTRDEDTRAALERIASDETEHAALAWRFVAWAIGRGGDDVRLAAARGLRAALEAFPALPLRGLPEYGCLAREAHLAAIVRARREVVLPAASLLGIA